MSTMTISGITKVFNNTVALNDISLTLEENKIYGLLGRNGAGKSTLLNLITNKIFPTAGEILLNGESVIENDRALSNIYCMSEVPLYPPAMRVKDAFKWSREFYPNFDMAYANSLTEKFSLQANKKIQSLSTGYSSIFKLIIALACNTQFVLLDEPVLGLDANHRDMFYKELIKSYADNPRTFVISTHLIEEVADIVEEVIIIKNGELLLQKSALDVKEMGYGVSGKATDVDEYIHGRNILSVETMGGLKTAYLLYSDNKPDAREIPQSLEVCSLDLQQLFIQLTNS